MSLATMGNAFFTGRGPGFFCERSWQRHGTRVRRARRSRSHRITSLHEAARSALIHLGHCASPDSCAGSNAASEERSRLTPGALVTPYSNRGARGIHMHLLFFLLFGLVVGAIARLL